MATCPACGETLASGAASDDLCRACTIALETGQAPEPAVGQEQIKSATTTQRKAPTPITYALIAINVILFVAMEVKAGWWPELSQEQYLKWGADWGPLSLHYQWWRMLTSTFVHANGTHLTVNLLFLLILGRRAERIFGKWIFFCLYLASGVAASIASLAFHPEAVQCGASGAVFGVLGVLISAFVLGKMSLSTFSKWWLGILSLDMLAGLYVGATDPQVSNSAHVAGLVSGFILGMLVLSERAKEPRFRQWLLSGTMVVIVLGATSVQLADGYLAPLALADSSLEQGRPEDALSYANLVLSKNPNSLLANIYVAKSYFKKRDYNDAEKAARRALATNPDSIPAKVILARSLALTKQVREAQEIVFQAEDQLIRENQFGSEFSFILEECEGEESVVRAGDALLEYGQPDIAIRAYKRALEDWPQSYKAQVGLAKAYQKKGMQQEAEAAAAKALEIQSHSRK